MNKLDLQKLWYLIKITGRQEFNLISRAYILEQVPILPSSYKNILCTYLGYLPGTILGITKNISAKINALTEFHYTGETDNKQIKAQVVIKAIKNKIKMV